MTFIGHIYSPEPSRLLYWFNGVVNEGDTVALDLTDGHTVMQSLYRKATYEKLTLPHVMNEYIEVNKTEYEESDIDTAHHDFCAGDIDIEGIKTEASLKLENGEWLHIDYWTTRGIYYFTPYLELKDHGCWSIDYFRLDSLLENAEVCVPFAIISHSKCDYKVFY